MSASATEQAGTNDQATEIEVSWSMTVTYNYKRTIRPDELAAESAQAIRENDSGPPTSIKRGTRNEAYAKLIEAPFNCSDKTAYGALDYARRTGMRRVCGAGLDVIVRYDADHGFRVYNMNNAEDQKAYSA